MKCVFMFQLDCTWRTIVRCFCRGSCGQTVTGRVTVVPTLFCCSCSVGPAAKGDIPPFPLRILLREAQGVIFISLPTEKSSCCSKWQI